MNEHNLFSNINQSYNIATYPNLFVPSHISEIRHNDFQTINVNEGGLNEFHSFDSGNSRYQWKINERGYIILRNENSTPGEDDWYPVFSRDQFNKVKEVWETYGANLNKLCGILNISCEILTALICRESRGNVDVVGLEEWIPPPDTDMHHPRNYLENIPPNSLQIFQA